MKIAVISGKGGSGKSSVSAALIAQTQRVMAIDCDVDASNLPLLFHPEVSASEPFASGEELQFGNTCIGCGSCAELCHYGAITMNDECMPEVNNLLCEGCGLCVRECPVECITLTEVSDSTIYTSTFEKGILIHGMLSPGDDNSGKMIARMREIADRTCQQQGLDLQILDGPPGIGCPVLSTVTGMDTIVMVTEPTRSGISDLQRAARVASSYCQDLRVIINKSDINAENAEAIRQLCAEQGWPVLAELPFDRRLVEAQLHCQSIVDYAPDSPCSQALRQAYQALCGSVAD